MKLFICSLKPAGFGGLIKRGRTVGILRTDIEIGLVVDIFLEIKAYNNEHGFLSRELVGRIVDFLLCGLKRES